MQRKPPASPQQGAPCQHQGGGWPQLLGSRQLNQGESSLTPQDLRPVLGNESQNEENISVEIALGSCLTWPLTQSTRLGLLSVEEPAFLEHVSSDSFGFLPWEDGLCQWRRLLISTDDSRNFNHQPGRDVHTAQAQRETTQRCGFCLVCSITLISQKYYPHTWQDRKCDWSDSWLRQTEENLPWFWQPPVNPMPPRGRDLGLTCH